MADIKIGCVAWGLPGGGYFAPEIAAKAGLDGIQLELESYQQGYPLAQREVMEGYLEAGKRLGIQYPAIVLNDVMENEFIHGRMTEHGRIAYDQMELAVETAAVMGIDKIMLPNFLANLITEESHIVHTVEALRFACRKARDKNIDILTENALDWKRQIQHLQDVGSDNLKVHFDTQNFKFNFDMDQCEQLQGLYPHMDKQLHVKDGWNEPGGSLLGCGNTDFFAQMKILREKNFSGWIIIENYYNLLPLRQKAANGWQMELLKKDIETINKCFGSR